MEKVKIKEDSYPLCLLPEGLSSAGLILGHSTGMSSGAVRDVILGITPRK